MLVWLHGGGWYVGDIECFDRVTRQLANASGAVCLSVDYRLAPEHPYPAAVQDALLRGGVGSERRSRQLGTDPARVVVGGDSAGGNLAAVGRAPRRDRLRAQLLVYPALDATMAGDSYREFADGLMLRAQDMEQCWDIYLGDADRTAPDVSPLNADDLAGVPPAYVAIAATTSCATTACATPRRCGRRASTSTCSATTTWSTPSCAGAASSSAPASSSMRWPSMRA